MMVEGFLTRSIMRPRRCWTVLHVSILAALLLTLNADSQDSQCEIGINVRRDTVYEASVGENLRINCTVVFCDNSPPAIIWYKLEENTINLSVNKSRHIKTEWKTLSHLKGMSFLIFQNVLKSDSGMYQCQSGHDVSHTINVSVTGGGVVPNVTLKNETNDTSTPTDHMDMFFLYMYCTAGIIGIVIAVIIISVLSMRGCKGKPKKEAQSENQYMVIPMVEQPFPPHGPQSSPRGSPSVPPSRPSTRKKTPSSPANEMAAQRENNHAYGKVESDRERQRNRGEEEGGSVVYAALNHQVPTGAAARPRRVVEETSEYAAIRVS